MTYYYSAFLYRSLCTLVCKWTYCPPEGWDASFWTSIGLEDLLENNFSKIGNMLFCSFDFLLDIIIIIYFSAVILSGSNNHSISTKLLYVLLKPCCSLSSRQCNVSSREPAGRWPHPGSSVWFGFETRNCSWRFTYWCSCWRLRYHTLNYNYCYNRHCCHGYTVTYIDICILCFMSYVRYLASSTFFLCFTNTHVVWVV